MRECGDGKQWALHFRGSGVSLSLFMEVNVLEFEEDLSASGHALLGRGGWDEHLGKRTAEGVEEAGP